MKPVLNKRFSLHHSNDGGDKSQKQVNGEYVETALLIGLTLLPA
jgi:hypothetical protein